MLEISTTCRCLVDSEKHGRDVGVDVFLIGCANVPNQWTLLILYVDVFVVYVHLHVLVNGDVKRKESWLNFITHNWGLCSVHLKNCLCFPSRNPHREYTCCDAFLMILVSLPILYEWCLFNDDFTDYRWYISMCWKYYLKIYNSWYDIACDVLQARPWLTFRPSAFCLLCVLNTGSQKMHS